MFDDEEDFSEDFSRWMTLERRSRAPAGRSGSVIVLRCQLSRFSRQWDTPRLGINLPIRLDLGFGVQTLDPP